jgi:hypothetical protein
MTETTGIYNLNKRDSSGQFAPSLYGEKKIRSMKLTNHAWDTLESMGIKRGMTRTDVIEELTRQETSEQQIILKAIQKFIELKKQSFPKHLIQKGKEFSTDTRSWDIFNEFLELIESSPQQLDVDR